MSELGIETLEKMEHNNKELLYEARKKNEVLAALLNVFIPGAGYLYCGNPILAILAFCIGLFLGFFTFFTAGFGLIFAFCFWLVLLIDGVLAANRSNRKLRKQILS